MILKKLSATLLALFIVGAMAPVSAFAEDVSGSEDFDSLNTDVQQPKKGETKKPISRVKQASKTKYVEPDYCAFSYPDTTTYGAEVIAVRRQLRIQPGEIFRVKVFLKNTSNIPWLSNKSECHGFKMSLGTDRERDHESEFYAEELQGWEAPNRIGMDQLRVDPGSVASFTFWAQAGSDPDVYKEYLTPVLKDVQWLDDAQFSFEVMIGETEDHASDLRKKIAYTQMSASVLSLDLDAPKLLRVDLSEQTLSAYLGDEIVKQVKISSGAPKTPTPKGTFKIFLKQEVRVGAAKPHYIMPRFQMFINNGTGFHALPSLPGDGGSFWTEARSHIGTPVSHGCVRLLPEDADWLFDFTNIGTTVEIVQ